MSVCLCTYNGQRYLRQQLESLVAQRLVPDELVVCDDRSDDGTVAMLEEFASSAPFEMILEVNATRLGISRNFEGAIRRAHGDVLLICDQDDVWHEDKVARMSAVFASQPGLKGAFHDSSLIDASGGELPGTLWHQQGLSRRAREELRGGGGLGYLVRHPRIAGHTLAIRREATPLLLPFNATPGYDTWIGRLLSSTGPLWPVDELLVAHRLHAGNSVGVWRSKPVSDRLQRSAEVAATYRGEVDGLHNLLVRLEERRPTSVTHAVRQQIDGKIEHLERRIGLRNPRPRPSARAAACATVLSELALLRYHRYSNGISSAAFDIASVCRRG
ncbi:MAG: glycosyltransferase [Acidimicrobiales bacterium]